MLSLSSAKKAVQKLHALTRIFKFMSIDQRKLIMNTFISSHFSYYPIIWMYHDRSLNVKLIEFIKEHVGLYIMITFEDRHYIWICKYTPQTYTNVSC